MSNQLLVALIAQHTIIYEGDKSLKLRQNVENLIKIQMYTTDHIFIYIYIMTVYSNKIKKI